MINKDFLEISLKHLKRKENIVYGLIFIFLVVILFLLLTFINLIIEYRNDSNKYDIMARTILVNYEGSKNHDFDKINNIKHVKYNISDKYYWPYYVYIKEFDVDNSKGYIGIKAIVENDSLKIINGRNIKNEKEILIPEKFYPHGMFTDDGKDIFINNNFINGKDLIGKEILIASNSDYPFRFLHPEFDDLTIEEYDKKVYEPYLKNQKKYSYKIVGTFDSNYNMVEKNVVFVSMKDLDDIKNEVKGENAHQEQDGTKTYNIDYYNGRMIIIDNHSNIEYVKKELTKMFFDASFARTTDEIQYKLLIYLPLIVAIIVFFASIILMKKFLLKKYNNIHNELGILKALGYNNKQIVKIELYENIIITLIGIIIAFILCLLIFSIIKKTIPFLLEAEYYSITIKLPYWYILLSIILIIIYVINNNRKISKSHLILSVNELLKED